MSRQQKIKRYHNKGSFYKAKPHPLAVVFTVILVGALIFLGVTIYEPVYNFIMGNVSSRPPVAELPADPALTDAADPEPEPEPAAAVHPEMHAAYLPAATIQNAAALDTFLASVRGSDINTVLVDIKDNTGTVLFNSKNESAAEWGTLAENTYDLAALSRRLAGENLMLAVRMSTFQDPRAAGSGREFAIHYQDSDWLWLDAAEENGGRPWLNPYSAGARGYLTDLAVEAVEAGATFVLLDQVQFPGGSTTYASFGPEAQTINRAQALTAFVSEITGTLEELGARTAVYVTAISTTQTADNETRYGGSPLASAGGTVVLGALPSQFEGGFYSSGMELSDPLGQPVQAVETALRILLDETLLAGGQPAYIPLLPGAGESGRAYTAADVSAAVAAARSRGLGEYILYSADGVYLLG